MADVVESPTVSSQIHYVKGDATLATFGEGRKLIAHVCNDIGGWGKGFVVAITRRFGEQARSDYIAWHRNRATNDFRLGAVQFVEVTEDRVIANMIGQHHIKSQNNVKPIRYPAIQEALLTIGEYSRENSCSIHMPRIGCGLAGGEWDKVEPLIMEMIAVFEVDVYVYDFEPSGPQVRNKRRRRGRGYGRGRARGSRGGRGRGSRRNQSRGRGNRRRQR